MKPLSSKTILLLYSRSATSSIPRRHFHSPPPSLAATAWRQHSEEESRGVRVSVWWDFENCHLPQGSNVFRVAHCITAAVRASGIKGPVQITAFGDVAQLSRNNQEAMSATGITLTHIPNGGKNSADRSLLVDLMCWVSHNPPPAHLFLISGDRDFATVLHRLRMSNYNILLASPESAPGVLCSAASIVWQWNALAKGENTTGKYFNQPPDGPYNSWYGHYKFPLENPFAVIEPPPSPRPEEISENNQETKPRPVPKTVIRQVRHILGSNPKGISITDLRSELGRCNIDKDLYGYKKFSRFLLSMPNILKLQSGPDGQLFVHSATPKWSEFAEPVTNGSVKISEELISKKKNEDIEKPNPVVISNKGVNGKPLPPRATGKNVKPYENIVKPLSTSNIEANSKKEKTKKPSSPNGVEVIVKINEKIEKTKTSEESSHSVEICDPTSEVGVFGRTWKQWLYGMDSVSETGTSNDESITKNLNVDESNFGSTSQINDTVGESSKFSSSNGKSIEENSGINVADSNKYTKDVGVFKRVAAFCMFWRETPTNEKLRAVSGENFEPATVISGKHELFSQEFFWRELETFLDTPPNGSVLVLHSMSREQMAYNLQKHGPLVLRTFSHSDLLQLVDLLITDKRWVEESLSQAYPFKLVLPPENGSSPNKSALSSAFLGFSSSSISETFSKKNQNIPRTGISPPITNKKTHGFNKSRNDILSDCQKLVDKIVKENPGGFNMALFRKYFLDSYGYPLDIQKLGYQKLVTLLQIMPGVKVEMSHIYPSCNNASGLENNQFVEENNELSDPPNKNDELEATWDELGPVAVNKKETNAKRVNRDYEALTDDYISDSDEENSSVAGSELPEKPGVHQEGSSLLRILDSWYGPKEEKDAKEGSESEVFLVNNSENESKGGSSSNYGGGGFNLKSEAPFTHSGLKTKPTRKFSFVSEQSGNNKDTLINGILVSLNKSGESRIHG